MTIEDQSHLPILSPFGANWTEEDVKREFPLDPTFSYIPNRHDWVERQFKNAPLHRGEKLPEGFPEAIDSPSVWDGFDIQNNPEKWLHYLTDEQNAALKAALIHWKSLNLPLQKLDRFTFPLPQSFKIITEEWVNKLLNGLGFFQLRGFNIDDYSEEDAIIV
ncbi:hypothetical protein HK100_001036, partial [Physocladia obscura]